MRTIKRTSLKKAAAGLRTSKLRWVAVVDCYGYDWDFEDEYAVSKDGELISFKHKNPTVLHLQNNHGYPTANMYTCGEKLNISMAQITKQVWGGEARLPKYACIRKDGDPGNIIDTNLVQATHWAHVRATGGPSKAWRELR